MLIWKYGYLVRPNFVVAPQLAFLLLKVSLAQYHRNKNWSGYSLESSISNRTKQLLHNQMTKTFTFFTKSLAKNPYRDFKFNLSVKYIIQLLPFLCYFSDIQVEYILIIYYNKF